MVDSDFATVASLEQRCIANGLRMTGLRRCMLAILVESVEHLTVLDVFERVAEKSLSTNASSIYRNMQVFESIGIVTAHRVKTPQVYYEIPGSVPDHFIDLHTGQAMELQHKALEVFKKAIVEQYGYQQEGCYLRFYASPKEKPSSLTE